MIHMSNWLSFFDLHVMLEGVRGPDVYCLALTYNESIGPASAGVARCEVVISGFDKYNDGLIRYWCVRIGRVQTVGGQPVNLERHAEMIRRSAAAQVFFNGYLTGRGFHPVPAALAMPIDLRTLEGDADSLDYNPESNTFSWRPQEGS